jgi:hypothetical protein
LQLVSAPDVILIAERDQVAAAQANCLFEILYRAEIALVKVQ